MASETARAPTAEVRVLGPLTVTGPNGPIDPGGHQLRLLLALLVANAGNVVTYDALIDGLWGEEPPASAKKSLQVNISLIRRCLGEVVPVRTVNGGYLIPAEHVEVDAERFERAVDDAASLVERDPGEASRILTEALGWWSGPAYADLAAEEGIRAEATRLDELRLRALELRIDAELRLGHHDGLVGELETLVLDHPYRERFQAQHMLALYRAGRQAEAVRAFDRTRRVLVEELGLEPSTELARLHRDILEQSEHLDLASGAPVGTGRSSTQGIRGYELRERIGRGRHGTVHRAFQRSIGREVALEVIDPDLANDAEFVRRFEAECRTVAQLEHPHIVTLLDSWREPDGAYLVTPWLRGGSVAASLERGPWRPEAALRLVAQIGSALAFAHERGVTHGDLTPSNVLLDEADNGYVAGFGPSIRSALAARGALPCARPAPGPAADIDAFARFAYELFTGRSPPPEGPPEPAAFTRADLPTAFDEVMARAFDPDPERRYARVEEVVSALRRAFGEELATREAAADRTPVRNPYKGLRAFGEADAPDFFGRDALLAQLAEQVGTTTLTTVVGPSGCGKSSLVKAGLIPLVRGTGVGGRAGWAVAEMCPGSYPFEELAACLLRVAVDRPTGLLAELVEDERWLMRVSKQLLPADTDLLLVIDQFEELFTQPIDAGTRQLFLANLVTVAADERSRVRIVLTLRADFFDRPLRHAAFGRMMQIGLVPVTAPTEGELAEVITRPAEQAGLQLEPGLVTEILHDVEHEPGALPLLEYALTELVGQREGHAMTLDAYHRIGGVAGALAARAERIHTGLSPRAQDAAQAIFVRLVRVHDEGGETRRRVRRTEIDDLQFGGELVATVLGAFGSYRLLTFDHDPVTRGPTVEVAHEALLREWPRYRSWVGDRRADLLFERRLADAAAEWAAAGRDRSLLFRGAHLDQYEGWAARGPVPLTAGEREFLDESRVVEEATQRSKVRRRRGVLTAISALALVAVAFAVVAVVLRNRAVDNAAVATDQAERADEAAAVADALRREAEHAAAIGAALVQATAAEDVADPDLALLLAIDANERLVELAAEDARAASALYQAVLEHDLIARLDGDEFGLPFQGVGRVPHVRWSANGDRLLLDDPTEESRLTILDIGSGNVIGTVEEPAGDRISLAHWDHAADLVYVGSRTGHVSVWDPDGPTLVDRLDLGDGWVSPFWSGGGQLLYLGSAERFFSPATVIAVESDTGEAVFESPESVFVIGVSPSGELLALWGEHDDLLVYRTGAWDPVSTITFDGLSRRVFDHRWGYELRRPAMAWVAGEDQLWVIDEQDRLVRIDARSGEQVGPVLIADVRASAIAPSPDGELIAVVLRNSNVVVHDTGTGALVAKLPVDTPFFWVAWTPDSRRLITIGNDSSLVWQASGPSAPDTVRTAWLPATTTELVGGRRFIGSEHGGGIVTDTDGAVRRTIPDHREVGGPAVVSSDGTTVVVPGQEAVAIRDAATWAVRADGPTGFPRPLAVSSDGETVLVATRRGAEDEESAIALVDGRTGEATHLLGAYLRGQPAAFTAEGTQVIIPIERSDTNAPKDTGSALWVVDVGTGIVRVRGPEEDCLTTVAVSPDDRFVAAGACDGHVSLYDLATLVGERPWTARIGQVDRGEATVQGVVFGPGLLVSTHADGRVNAWSLDPAMAERWSFDLGVPIGAPTIRDGMLWFGAMDRELGGGVGEHGGVIGVPLDRDRLLDVALTTVSRDFTDAECRRYFDRRCSGR